MLLADLGSHQHVNGSDERFAEPVDTLRIGSIERDSSEELCRHTTTLAGIELAARRARASRLRLTKLGEQIALLPDVLEATAGEDRTRLEIVVKNERTGVDVPKWVDQADHSASPAQVETANGYGLPGNSSAPALEIG